MLDYLNTITTAKSATAAVLSPPALRVGGSLSSVPPCADAQGAGYSPFEKITVCLAVPLVLLAAFLITSKVIDRTVVAVIVS